MNQLDKDAIILRDRFLSFLVMAERMAAQGNKTKVLDALGDDAIVIKEALSSYLHEFLEN